MPKSTDKMFFRWNGTKWVLKSEWREGKGPARPTLSEERKQVKRILTPVVRAGIAKAADYTCTYCRRVGGQVNGPDGSAWELDHVIPVSRGGSFGVDNVVLSCRACNQAKGKRTPEEWAS